MSKNSLLLVPSGGLANRMRAIASSWQLCQRLSAPHRGLSIEVLRNEDGTVVSRKMIARP